MKVRRRRPSPFVMRDIAPPRMASGVGRNLDYGCPDCGYNVLVGIMNEDLSEEAAVYCSGCNTQFLHGPKLEEVPIFSARHIQR